MQQIYKKVTFQLGDVLNGDMFYPNSYLKSKGIKPLEEDETEEEKQRKIKLIQQQEEERLRKIRQAEMEKQLEEERRLNKIREDEENERQQQENERLRQLQEQQQKDLEKQKELEKQQKEQAEKYNLSQKGILKKQKMGSNLTLYDEHGNPIKSNNPLYKLKVFNTWEKIYKVGPGLTNFGNTCFLNSILQVLTYTPPLVNYFMQRKHSAVCLINSQKRKMLANNQISQEQAKAQFCLICFLENHIKKCFTTTINVIHPISIVNNMKKLISDFKIGKQEDPLTLFMVIVSAIKQEPLKSQQQPIQQNTSKKNSLEFETQELSIPSQNLIQNKDDSLIQQQYLQKNDENQNQQNSQKSIKLHEQISQQENQIHYSQSIIDDQIKVSNAYEEMDEFSLKTANLFNNMFTGAIQYNIYCTNCKMEEVQYELFYTLVLELKGMDTLDDCLSSKFGEKEATCKSCKIQGKAIRTSNIYNFPNIMVIKINRFSGIMKFQKNIEFKPELNLQEYSIQKKYSPQYNYALYAMLTHSGSVAWGGHYYSYVKDSSENWHCMNDSSIKQVTIEEVQKDPPYLLFYIKQEPTHQLAIPDDLVRQKDQLKELSRSLSQKRSLVISSKKKIDISPENFYNVIESSCFSARGGNNLQTMRSNNPSPLSNTRNSFRIPKGSLRESSKSPQSLLPKSQLGTLAAPSPFRSRGSIQEDEDMNLKYSKGYQIRKAVGRQFNTPKKIQDYSFDSKRLQNDEKNFYQTPLSDEKQRITLRLENEPNGVLSKIKQQKQFQGTQISQGVSTSMNNPITNQDKAFGQNFDFEKSRIVKMPKIRSSQVDKSDDMNLSDLSMISKKNNDRRKKLAGEHQQQRGTSQQEYNKINEKQFNYYEDYDKKFLNAGIIQQVYDISYTNNNSARNSYGMPQISPKKLNKKQLNTSHNNSLSNNFEDMNLEQLKPKEGYNIKKYRKAKQEKSSLYQNDLRQNSHEPFRKESKDINNQTQSKMNNIDSTNHKNYKQINTKNKINQPSQEHQQIVVSRHNSNQANKKRRRRSNTYEPLRSLLENHDQRRKSLPDSLFYKQVIKKKKRNVKSAKVNLPDWQS